MLKHVLYPWNEKIFKNFVISVTKLSTVQALITKKEENEIHKLTLNIFQEKKNSAKIVL